jgi:hypothetical protein
VRLAVAWCIAAMMLAGCSVTGGRGPLAPGSSPATSSETSIGASIAPDVAALDHADDSQRTPGEAAVALIDAGNKADWKTTYSLYATPEVDFETARRDWTAADETYEGFRVLEVRVVAPDTAYVRVAYRAVTTPPSGSAYPVTVDGPGEWWPVHKVGGLWKIQWLPRQ